ncbi:class I poly(R)-hydroxyalkanoic acid synthase [Asticcacaulis sp. EMRT-3]|uniref:class I poly(R)-hydroxyalkanoic acid synthase n=1 Tax=Asticcacaulis sp. EMRT-3 TaxID=3040349 RepID=UPI0024AF241E|nr:class I poly(R)-hydroxyalkanoic acid synthase [Asticcacaulis sp. EMRT-3]MDI7774473.1 class I poly(R)-hydroxyalkanoic acid synthase [Asticcacaulis sp. EMRT-3]
MKAAAENPAATAPLDTASAFDTDTMRRLETLSLNIAKAGMTAQSALARTLFRPPEDDAGPADPFQVGPAMTEVASALASKPEKLIEAQNELLTGYMGLWGQMARRSLGKGADDDTAQTGVKKPFDKRFADPRWEQNMVFDMMKQSYLLSSNWINKLIASAEGIDPLVKRRAEFFTKLLTDAMSPANFLLTNPAALETLLETGGESLVKGMERFADDLARGDGKLKISQADYGHFRVGENVATSPGKVVWRGPYFELLQFSPASDEVRETPLLIFPPWINKYYILDLQPKNSLIKWLTEQGFTVFLVSWINPDASMKDTSFEDYMFGGIYEAVARVKEQCGVDQVNAVGYCIGGTLLGVTLAHMAAKGDTSIASATFFTAQHDFSEAGDLLLFTSEHWLNELERQMDAAGGVLPGTAMADTFNALRANDLIWSFFVNNYLLGRDLTAFDLLYWNADQTRMPKALHLFYLRKFYGENALSQHKLTLAGVDIDLKQVKIPIYEQAGREDHIAPPGSVYKGSKLFGGPVTFMLAGSGHIAGVVNPPAAQKYMHWLNDAHPDTLDDWLSGAEMHAGSWWPHWAAWLHERSGPMIAARDPAKGRFKPLMDAPGAYVLVKS